MIGTPKLRRIILERFKAGNSVTLIASMYRHLSVLDIEQIIREQLKKQDELEKVKK